MGGGIVSALAKPGEVTPRPVVRVLRCNRAIALTGPDAEIACMMPSSFRTVFSWPSAKRASTRPSNRTFGLRAARRYATNQFLLMTSLAYRPLWKAARRRRRSRVPATCFVPRVSLPAGPTYFHREV